MKELKIDEKLKALFTPLSNDMLLELENKLTKKYDGTPLYVWKGNIIVDGHNRYPLLKKHNIEFEIENVEDFLGEDCTRSDVMTWMVSHQRARRNLEDGELITVNKVIAEEIALENEQKMLEGFSNKRREEKLSSVQMDGGSKSHTSPTHTREQVAKMSGVSTGTVARYDAVMKSDNEELKEKLRTGQVKVGTAYREIKQKESKKRKETNNSFKDVSDEFVGMQSSGHFGEYTGSCKTTNKSFTSEDVVNAYKDSKTLKNALDVLDICDEFETFKDDVMKKIEVYDNRLFYVYHIDEKISESEKDFAINAMNELVMRISKIITKIKGE